jgi:hypothetical protein
LLVRQLGADHEPSIFLEFKFKQMEVSAGSNNRKLTAHLARAHANVREVTVAR